MTSSSAYGHNYEALWQSRGNNNCLGRIQLLISASNKNVGRIQLVWTSYHPNMLYFILASSPLSTKSIPSATILNRAAVTSQHNRCFMKNISIHKITYMLLFFNQLRLSLSQLIHHLLQLLLHAVILCYLQHKKKFWFQKKLLLVTNWRLNVINFFIPFI